MFGRLGNYRDVMVRGDSDQVMERLSGMLGWEEDWSCLMKEWKARPRSFLQGEGEGGGGSNEGSDCVSCGNSSRRKISSGAQIYCNNR